MDTVMYMCCMNHSIRLDRMKNSFEYITLSYLSGGIFFFEHSPLFRSDMHTKASKKDSLLTVCKIKKGNAIPL